MQQKNKEMHFTIFAKMPTFVFANYFNLTRAFAPRLARLFAIFFKNSPFGSHVGVAEKFCLFAIVIYVYFRTLFANTLK
jgi:hypothetical protein